MSVELDRALIIKEIGVSLNADKRTVYHVDEKSKTIADGDERRYDNQCRLATKRAQSTSVPNILVIADPVPIIAAHYSGKTFIMVEYNVCLIARKDAVPEFRHTDVEAV